MEIKEKVMHLTAFHLSEQPSSSCADPSKTMMYQNNGVQFVEGLCAKVNENQRESGGKTEGGLLKFRVFNRDNSAQAIVDELNKNPSAILRAVVDEEQTKKFGELVFKSVTPYVALDNSTKLHGVPAPRGLREKALTGLNFEKDEQGNAKIFHTKNGAPYALAEGITYRRLGETVKTENANIVMFFPKNTKDEEAASFLSSLPPRAALLGKSVTISANDFSGKLEKGMLAVELPALVVEKWKGRDYVKPTAKEADSIF